MAKTNPLGLLLIVLVVAFLLLMLSSTYDYVPYNKAEAAVAKYEAMTVAKKEEEEDVEEEAKEEPKESPMVYLNTEKVENFEPITDVAKTIYYGPLRDSEIIDKFSQVTKNGVDGVDGCVSSGLSNAGGYMCLTPELIKLLKTRGGNATGVEMK